MKLRYSQRERDMTDGEKRIAQLLENMISHMVAIRTDLHWFRQREQQKQAAIQGMAANLPQMPKIGE